MGDNPIDIHVLTLNVRGLRERTKRISLFKWLNDLDADVIFLQETHVTQSFVSEFNQDWSGKAFHGVTDSSHSRGVAILIKNKINFNLINIHSDNEGRKIFLNCEIDKNNFSLLCAYAPNDGKRRVDFLKRLPNG